MPSVSGLAISLSLIGVLVVACVARLAYWFLSSIFRLVMIGVFTLTLAWTIRRHGHTSILARWVCGSVGWWFLVPWVGGSNASGNCR